MAFYSKYGLGIVIYVFSGNMYNLIMTDDVVKLKKRKENDRVSLIRDLCEDSKGRI